jgi:Glutathione S-transferase, N-terminal domain
VNLFEGANFSPEFLKLVSLGSVSIVYALIDVVSFQNPNGTLPTLTHEGKSYKSTAEVIDYLVSISSTKVAPETSITKVVHEDGIDPNFSMVAAVSRFAITLMRLTYLMMTKSEK